MRMRKKKNLLPRLVACDQQRIYDPYSMRGHWRDLFPSCQSLWVELGCGKGKFTVEKAKENPDVLFIAVEKVLDAMVVAMERCMAENISNVYFVGFDANQICEAFEPKEIDRIFINFCDPWPKKNQAKRRLTHEAFLSLYQQVLADHGQIWFKTDNVGLFEFSTDEFPKCSYIIRSITDDLHAKGINDVMTDYETKFYNQGVPIHRIIAEKE